MVEMRGITAGWYRLRWVVLQRDGFACQYCGAAAPDVKLEVDHVLAVCNGGTDDLDNLRTSCYACNRGKEAYRAWAFQQPSGLHLVNRSPDYTPLAGSLGARALAELQQEPLTTRQLAARLAQPRDSNVMRVTVYRLFKRGLIVHDEGGGDCWRVA